MIAAKTELAVSYTSIINLQSVLRDLMAEYAVHTSRILIQQPGRPEENVILIFGEEFYLIECNWNRVQFRSEGPRTSYDNANGPLRFFFELLVKLSELSGFGKFRTAYLKCIDILEETEVSFITPEAFAQHFFSSEAVTLFGSMLDNAIVVVQKIRSGSRELALGPFIFETDIEKHGLRVFESGNAVDFSGVIGLLAKTEIITERIDADHKLYLLLDKHHKELLKLLRG